MEKLWGSRFKKKTHPLVEKFTSSIGYDYKLAKYDLAGSMLHVDVLSKSGYLSSDEAAKIKRALESLKDILLSPKFKPNDKDEDIHTLIQNELQKKVGDLALKLHTARSRNEQVVLATKLYCQEALGKMHNHIHKAIKAIAELADKHKNIIIPGLTHLQHAQPVYLKDHLMAYLKMLERDSARLGYIAKNINLEMGAGALAGTPIEAAKYPKATTNSLDTVSDRDFVIEIISALSITAMHLSRLAEDLIIWSTKEFDFLQIDEAFCTGSSLMPQKKNPDVLELIRGYAGRLYGNLVNVLTVMKGLPLTYNRDMQLDKEPLFDSFEIVAKELEVLTALVKTLKFNEAAIKEHLKDESLYATDLVYYLVDKGIAFKEAHNIVGKLVNYSLGHKIEIKELPAAKLRQFSKKFVKDDVIKLFDPKVSVKSKKSINRKKR